MSDKPERTDAVSDVEIQNDKERRLLDQLDAMADEQAWEAIVAYMAAKMVSDNPKTLAEAIIRRGMMRAAKSANTDEAEVIAQTFAAVGVRLSL